MFVVVIFNIGSVKQRTPQQKHVLNNKIQQHQFDQQVPVSPTYSSSSIPPTSPTRSPPNTSLLHLPTNITASPQSPNTVTPLMNDLSLEKSIPHKARSITSGASLALTSSCSITSSKTEDSTDEESRKKVCTEDHI